MNRRQRRIEAAAQRRHGKAMERDKRDGVLRVDEESLMQLLDAQKLLVAITRSQGRVRLTEKDLEGLKDGDSVKSSRTSEGLVLTFVPGPVQTIEVVDRPAAEGDPG